MGLPPGRRGKERCEVMAKKGNIRSMRFSDEILEIIESQPGETFTAKFEHLVTRCIMELPRKEQELQ